MQNDRMWPTWAVLPAAAALWLLQHALKRWIPLWAVITLPATALHELAHAVVGLLCGARPSSWTLWPRRVSASAWRLGGVGFLNLRWWNGGAVALAPLLWLLVISVLARMAALNLQVLPAQLPAWGVLVAAAGVVWLWIAVAPSRSDWQLALQHWPSAIAFLGLWASFLYTWLEPAWRAAV